MKVSRILCAVALALSASGTWSSVFGQGSAPAEWSPDNQLSEVSGLPPQATSRGLPPGVAGYGPLGTGLAPYAPAYYGGGKPGMGGPSSSDIDLGEAPEISLDFTEQSTTFASTNFAAPSFIGDFFGTGSSTATVVNLTTVTTTATGILTTQGGYSYYLGSVTGPADFVSVGSGSDTSGNMFVDTYQLAVGSPMANVCQNGTFQSGVATDPSGTATSGTSWDLTYTCQELLEIVIPNIADSGGAVVGRLKIAENSSPIPRDRVFFNYSLFDNVPLTAGGATVNRFSPGFEKTFVNRTFSIEARFPFASSLDPNIVLNRPAEFGSVQLGNMFVALKAAILRTDQTIIAGGFSLALPTGPDLNVTMTDGMPLIHVKNESVRIMPFVGALTNLTDRMYGQAFMQIDVDPNGNEVRMQDFSGPMGNMAPVGTIHGATFMYVDAAVGYWIRRPGEVEGALIDGMTSTLEAHFNRSLQESDSVSSGQMQIGGGRTDIQILNVVAGTTLMAGPDSYTFGYAFPLTNGSDQIFDGELRAFWNRDF